MSYYNLEQTLEVFQKNLPETLLPFGLPQLADLCRRGEVTPVLPYARYVSEGFLDENGQLVSTKKDTKPFNGYLTLPDLTDLLFQLTETLIVSNAYIYEEIGTKDKGALVTLEKGGYDHNDYYHERDYRDGLSSGDTHYIGINNLLLPIEQVQAYIALKNTDNLNVTTQLAELTKKLEVAKAKLATNEQAQSTGSFMMGTPAVTSCEPKTDKERVIELEEKLKKLNLEFNKLQQQNTEIQSNSTQIKNQDGKLVVYLAFILSQKSSKYRKNNGSINAQQIGEAITTIAQELGLSKDDMHGFKRPDVRLRTLIGENKELLINFEKAIEPNADAKNQQ